MPLKCDVAETKDKNNVYSSINPKISDLWANKRALKGPLQAKFVRMNGTDEDDNGMYEIIQREITNLKSLSHNQRKTIQST